MFFDIIVCKLGNIAALLSFDAMITSRNGTTKIVILGIMGGPSMMSRFRLIMLMAFIIIFGSTDPKFK